MVARVLIVGGYGNFGRVIARMLAREEDLQLIISGRHEEKAKQLASDLESQNKPETARLDINDDFISSLAHLNPDIVIHTSGPFQGQDYRVAAACVRQGCHYIDLADSREFVVGIGQLDQEAKQKGVLICSGASSVPCLTSAVIDACRAEFETLEHVDYGIATAQLTNRGLATTSAVLSYAGKPFETLIDGEMRRVHGWLDLRFRKFWGLNRRPMGNCDVPDLGIFPGRYPGLRSIRFQAGLELKILHFFLWSFAGLVRLKLLPSLQPLAPYLLGISRLFDPFGKDDSGFYMALSGTGKDGNKKEVNFDLVARQGDGLYIPSMPAILLAKKLANRMTSKTGATPCVDLITLDEYLTALGEFRITWRTA